VRALILGGSGLIGTPIARALLAAGHDVTTLSRGDRALPDAVRPLRADRDDPASIDAALAGGLFDLAVDLLAFRGADVERLFAVPGLRIARYVVISSGQVYLVASEPTPPFSEQDAVKPLAPEPAPGTRDHANWVYGAGKREVERATRDVAARRGVSATILRLPVVQGAGDGTRRLWSYLQRMQDGGPLLLPGGGEDPVRFVWAEDVGRAVATLAAREAPPADAYNLSQPDEPALRAFLVRAARLLDVTPRFAACGWEDVAAAGLEPSFSPFSGPWCSRPDSSLAQRDWGFACTPSERWLPEVVAAHLAEPDPAPHPGYARRALELALASRLIAAPGAA